LMEVWTDDIGKSLANFIGPTAVSLHPAPRTTNGPGNPGPSRFHWEKHVHRSIRLA